MSRRPLVRSLMLGLTIATLQSWFVAAAAAQQRPKAVDLLPEKTVLYVQLDDVKQFIQDMSASGFGQMLQDERIAPFVTELYGEAKAAYQDIEEQVGVSFDELESLPQGEICFAIVTPRRDDPAFVLVIDVNAETGAAQKLIDRGTSLAEGEGAVTEVQEQMGLQIHSVVESGDEQVHYVLHEGTFIAATNPTVLSEMLIRWKGEPDSEDRSLAENRKFVTIMNKCRSTEDLPMAMSFFVDPIAMVRGFTRGDLGTRAMLAALPVLGLDGLLAVGGASVFNEQGYESVFHLHVLLANPRAGIFEMIALKPGQYEPEPWVPDDVVTYVTSSWDIRKFMVELEKIVDTFGGEGFMQSQIDNNVNEELGINLQTDLIENLEGRITYIQWIADPPRFNSQINGLGVRVNDVEKASNLIESLLARVDENRDDIVQSTYEGIDYWHSARAFGPDERDQEEALRRTSGADADEDLSANIALRPVQPCFGFVGDNFILTESKAFFERVIRTYNGDEPKLADDELFRRTTEEMVRLLDTGLPSVTMYQRPDLAFRMWFDLLKTENTQSLLARGADQNKYVRGLKRVVDENPLPEFDEVKHYFAPSGAFIVNDETGFHLLAFQFKPEDVNK